MLRKVMILKNLKHTPKDCIGGLSMRYWIHSGVDNLKKTNLVIKERRLVDDLFN